MRAAELVGTEQAERRVLRLTNPELPGRSASNTGEQYHGRQHPDRDAGRDRARASSLGVEPSQSFGRGADPSVTKYGAGGLRPAWEAARDTRYSPLWHYPWSATRAALERLATEHEGSPFDGVIVEYTNPLTGGPAMPTIACYAQMLRPGQHTEAHRPVFLFSFTDAPVMKALDLYREDAKR